MRLGKALGILARQYFREYLMHADVDAFYAPSECHDLVRRGEERRMRQARRHAKAVSGLNRRSFRRLAAANSRHVDACVNRLIAECPFQ